MGSSVPVIRIGWPDQFIEQGHVYDLRAKYGLTVEAAREQLLPLLTRCQRPTLVAS
jgi:1-deoxy-D-xylulose-5-phosphate synthase